MYGTQTSLIDFNFVLPFENDVKMYGTQTCLDDKEVKNLFENDVKMYGTQTSNAYTERYKCLRMM